MLDLNTNLNLEESSQEVVVVTTGNVTDMWQLPLYLFSAMSPSNRSLDPQGHGISWKHFTMDRINSWSKSQMIDKIVFFLTLCTRNALASCDASTLRTHWHISGNRNFSDPTPVSLVILITSPSTVSLPIFQGGKPYHIFKYVLILTVCLSKGETSELTKIGKLSPTRTLTSSSRIWLSFYENQVVIYDLDRRYDRATVWDFIKLIANNCGK